MTAPAADDTGADRTEDIDIVQPDAATDAETPAGGPPAPAEHRYRTWDDDEDENPPHITDDITDDYVHPARPLVLATRWTLITTAAGIGWVAFTAASDVAARAGWSYVAGLALVILAFEFGAYNVRFATRYLPHLALPIAMMSYTVTIVALGVFYAVSSPRVIDALAAGIGIFVGVGIWIGTEIARTRVRSAQV